VAHFHLHPAAKVTRVAEGASITLPDGNVISLTVDGGRIEITDSTWHPEFGKSVLNQKLFVVLAGPTLRTVLRW
jgi:hypothetical protein